jgi:hypothetical protein
VKEVAKYEFGVVTCGKTPIPNFMNSHPAILQLLNAYVLISAVKRPDWVRLGEVGDAPAQRIVINGVIIVPPHELEDLSHWYLQLLEKKTYYCGPGFNCIIFIPNFMKICL